MAEIPRRYIDEYTKALNTLSADVQKRLAEDLAKIDFTADVADIREAVIDRMEFYLGPYTDMAAVVASEFYDGIREISAGEKIGALAESGREPVATERAVRGIMDDVVKGKAAEVVIRKLVDRADYEIKKAAGECVYRNGKRDPLKPKYALVPSGGETCRFCIMLASRGFVYHNAKQAGENGHYHANCDCRIVPGFEDSPSVAGYDPNVYYEQYQQMLEGHEIESHYDLQTRNGKATKRMYETAKYDYGAALSGGSKKAKTKPDRNDKMSRMEHNEPLVNLSKDTNGMSVSDVVNKKAFHDAFIDMPLPKKVSETLYAQAGRILSDTNGTEFERLVAVGARTGKVIADNFGERAYPRKSRFSNEAMARMKSCGEDVVLIHNHPRSAEPSYADIMTAAIRNEVAASVVVGHDGSVWYFSVTDQNVALSLESYYNDLKDLFGDYAEVMAVKQLVEDNERRHLFDWRRLM